MHSINCENFRDRPEPAASVLYVVGTPIGNLSDLSPRAKLILSKVSFIACEDTRRAQILLKSFEAKTPLISFHKHNTKSRIPKLLEHLQSGESLALISDAGLPGISDPGEELVSEIKNKGYEVICIPGPCAAIAALVSSGLPSKRFCFEGFLPTKTKERKKAIEAISKEERTTVIYESPHRIMNLLEDLSNSCGEDRPLQLARELTKRYEQTLGSNIGEVLKYLKEHKIKGEFTIVLGGLSKQPVIEKDKTELLIEINSLISQGTSKSEAIKKVSEENNYSRRVLYSLLHEQSG